MSHSWGQFLFLVSDGLSGSSWISVTVTVSRWAQRLGFGFQGKLNFTRSSHSHEPGVCPRGSGGRGLVVSPEDSVCEGWGAAAGFGAPSGPSTRVWCPVTQGGEGPGRLSVSPPPPPHQLALLLRHFFQKKTRRGPGNAGGLLCHGRAGCRPPARGPSLTVWPSWAPGRG